MRDSAASILPARRSATASTVRAFRSRGRAAPPATDAQRAVNRVRGQVDLAEQVPRHRFAVSGAHAPHQLLDGLSHTVLRPPHECEVVMRIARVAIALQRRLPRCSDARSYSPVR